MTDADQARAFVESLPRLQPEDRFRFRCDPSVACFNSCCADLHLELSPYDAFRLRRALGTGGREFLQRHTEVGRDPESGFPQVLLQMREDGNRSCPFLQESGCGVYADRPGACRSYPVGRGAVLSERGQLSERFVLVREEHCLGFEGGREWTAREWLKDQGMQEYNLYNDRYLNLLSRWRQGGLPVPEEKFPAVLLALYDSDDPESLLQPERLLKLVGK